MVHAGLAGCTELPHCHFQLGGNRIRCRFEVNSPALPCYILENKAENDRKMGCQTLQCLVCSGLWVCFFPSIEKQHPVYIAMAT